MEWDTSCKNWEARLLAGKTLVPDLPLFKEEADRAEAIFRRLKIPDVVGTPLMDKAAGEWLFPIVRALFGSFDPRANRRAIQEYFLLVPKKNGKALALDTEVATPDGFKRISEIEIGDLVIGDDGIPTRVIDKSPIFINHCCYELEFSTGERVVCDAGHLWVTDAHKDRENKNPRGNRTKPRPSVKTTEEIAETLHVKSGRLLINNHRTALPLPLEFPEANLPIDPYALGAWLGDGTSVCGAITSGENDADEMVSLLVANGHPAYLRKPNKNGSRTISLSTGERIGYCFLSEARRLGVVDNKHIPQRYLRASRSQREALLRGLMDTDGTISKAGQATFTTTNAALKRDVLELVNSLGLKGSVQEKRAMLNGRDCGPAWHVQFWPFDEVRVFSLERKLARQRCSAARNCARSRTRQIVSARKIDSVPVQCISVDNASKQFLITRSLIPTHNSSSAAAIMVTALIMNRRPIAEFLLIAPTKEIADIAFRQAANIVNLDAALSKLFHMQRHLRLITHRESGATLAIKASDTDVITGSKSTGILVDETHVFAKKHNAADVFVEIRGALAARPEGFMIQITTQSKEPPAGVFKNELQIARDVRDGLVKMPLLPILYELPKSISENGGWRKESTWPLVNPNLGLSVNPDFLRNQLVKAERDGPEALALLASQHFNVEIGMSLRADRWAGADFWRKAVDPDLTLDAILERSDVAVVGIDGGGLDDLFGLAVMGRDAITREWLGWTHAWAFKSVFERRKSEAPRLLDFEADGDLTVVETLGDDIAGIVGVVKKVDDAGILSQVGLDPMGVGLVVDGLSEAGIDGDRVAGVSQGYRLNGAIKTLERKLADGTFWHNGRPLMDWCVANARVEQKGNAIVITKQASGTAKIDPLMALLDAAALMALNPEPVSGKAEIFIL